MLQDPYGPLAPRCRSVTRGLPVAERLAEAFALGDRDLLLGEHAGKADRLAHLLHVGGASVAPGEVLVESRAIFR